MGAAGNTAQCLAIIGSAVGVDDYVNEGKSAVGVDEYVKRGQTLREGALTDGAVDVDNFFDGGAGRDGGRQRGGGEEERLCVASFSVAGSSRVFCDRGWCAICPISCSYAGSCSCHRCCYFPCCSRRELCVSALALEASMRRHVQLL
jgi:hypothetical protein